MDVRGDAAAEIHLTCRCSFFFCRPALPALFVFSIVIIFPLNEAEMLPFSWSVSSLPSRQFRDTWLARPHGNTHGGVHASLFLLYMNSTCVAAIRSRILHVQTCSRKRVITQTSPLTISVCWFWI